MSTTNNGKTDQLIDAVAYTRKSTRGEHATATGKRRERQEKSPEQQRAEILKHAKGRFRIVRWYEDEASGWKREAARPGFTRMLADAREQADFKAIVADDADRFSRASYRKVLRDVDDLADAGVAVISCVNGGDFRIADETDAGEAHRLVAVAMANHEFSRKLSRRVTLARRNAAEDGKRTGGPYPYGLVSDGEGSLKHGDPAKIEVVRWLFDQFGNHRRSLGWLAGDLNARKVPPMRGKAWYPKQFGNLLRQRSYRGDFTFNVSRRGQFYGIDSEGEVVERAKLDGAGRVFLCEGAHAPVIEPDLFDRVQERLARIAGSRKGRKNMGHALTGILVCGHCGTAMYAAAVKRKRGKDGYGPTVYRCNGNSLYGRGKCRQYQIHESDILPFVLRMLGEEITDIKAMLTAPPDSLRSPYKAAGERRAQVEQERADLASQIETAEGNLLFVKDARTRASLDRKVSDLRDRLDLLDAELATARQQEGYTQADLDALSAWWDAFEANAVRMPVPDENMTRSGAAHGAVFPFYLDRDATAVSGECTFLIDPRKVNDALHQLGCKVRLFWKAERYTSMQYHDKRDAAGVLRGGKPKERLVLTGGRFRLGQREGALPPETVKQAVSDTMACRRGSPPCASPAAARRSRPTARRPVRSNA
jgi:DNA invertase Pin-like site-specific DNA recombinase